MFRASYAKKALAILMTLALLASCLAVAGVSAASAKGTWDCEAPTSSRTWKTTGDSSDNTLRTNYSMKLATGVDGAHSGTGVAVAKYEANGTAETDEKYVQTAAGRLAIGTSSQNLTYGKSYRVVFWYKIKSITTDTKINLVVASRNWASNQGDFNTNVADPQIFEAATLKTTDATDEWVKADVIFKNDNNNKHNGCGLHIAVQPVDGTKGAGTEIWMDDFEYYELEDADFITLTLEPNYAGATATTAQGLAGDPITATLSRPRGYTFLGWFTEADGGDQVTAFPNANTTLYAHWQAPDTPMYEIHFEGNGGTVVGNAIDFYGEGDTFTQTAVRSGYKFLGWKDADDKFVTAAPAANITLTAAWEKLGEYSPLDGLQSFENITIDDLVFSTSKPLELTTEENHTYAGGTSLKRSVGMSENGQRIRPRLLLGDVTPGKSYTVSFWLKSANPDPAGSGGGFRFWLGTYDKTNIKSDISNEGGSHADYHTLQTLSNANRGKLDADGGVTNARLSDRLPTEWTRYTVTVDSVTAKKGATDNCLVLGYADDNSYADVNNPNKKYSNTLYIDDVQIVETSTLGENAYGYESKEVGTYPANNGDTDKVAGTGKGRTVTNEVMNHTFGYGGVGNTLKIDLTGEPVNDPRNCYTAVYKSDGTVLRLTQGYIHTVSAWLYSAKEATVAVYARAASAANDWVGTNSAVLAETTVTLPANKWTQVELTATVPMGKGYNVLALGFANTVADATDAIYLDDTSYTATRAVQDYERVAAADILGSNAALATDQNHTTNGHQSLKLTLSGTQAGSRSYSILNSVGSYYSVAKDDTEGKMAYFYAYNPDSTDKTVSFAFGATPALDLSTVNGFVTYEVADSVITATLKANSWTPVLVTTANGITTPGAFTQSYVMLSVWGADGVSGDVYIDDLRFDNYTQFSMDPLVQSFEDTDIETNLNLRSDGGLTVTLDQNHSTDGMRSVKVTATNNGGGTRPQMTVTNGKGEKVRIEKGKKYQVSFWVYAPEDNMSLRYWLCATEDETPFTSGPQKDARKVFETGQDIKLTAGAWTEVTASISDTNELEGYLRLGIATGNAHQKTEILYLDDIKVRELKKITYDPNATVQNFENFNLGDGKGTQDDLKFILKGDGGISDAYNHGTSGSQSLMLKTISWGGTNRNQFVLINPANGQPLEFTEGEDYILTFWVYMAEDDSYDQGGTMSLNYWLQNTDDPTKEITNKNDAAFDIGGNSNNVYLDCDEWHQVRATFTAKKGKYIVMGISDNTSLTSGSTYYIDDMEVTTPQHVKVRYHITGGATLDPSALQAGMTKTELADEIVVEVDAIAGMELSAQKKLTMDPYREGYEMTGWYTNPSCNANTLFDLQYDLIEGKEGDVIDLYTGWKQWGENTPSEDNTEHEEEIKYRDVIEWVKNWIGDDVEDPTLEAGDRPEVEEADPVSTKPKTDKDKNDAQTDGMATWLIIVIVAAAVAVVGGGAGLALVLLKKKKA